MRELDSKKILSIVLCVFLILGCIACSTREDLPENDTNTTENTIRETSPNEDSGMDISAEITRIEYEILLGALRDANITEQYWAVTDGDQDGNEELYIRAKTRDGEPGYALLLADADSGEVWSYAATGVAGFTQWVQIPGVEGIVWHDGYSTLGTQKSVYAVWNGQQWEEQAVLKGGLSQNEDGKYVFTGDSQWFGEELSYDEYCEKENQLVKVAELAKPNLKINSITADAEKILPEIDAYFRERNGFVAAINGDVDSDGEEERLYIVTQAANRWLDVMNVENCWGDEKHINYKDQGTTIVIADKAEAGVCIQTTRVNICGNDYSIRGNYLVIDAVEYVLSNGEFCVVTQIDKLLEMTSDEIELQLFETPYSIYRWFTGAVYAGKTSEEATVIDGKPYYQILDGAYVKYDDMISYAEKYFSKELLEEFIAQGNVIEVDGSLYQFNPGYGGAYDPGYPVEYYIVSHAEKEVVFCRCSKYPKDPWTNKTLEQMTDEDYNSFYTYYVMELIDNRWLFTEWEQSK